VRRGRAAALVGAVLVLSGIPSAGSAQDAGTALVGYDATASGTAFTAFPRLPALLPVEVPVEATVALATATLSSGGQGFARASTFYPGSLTAGLRPLLETGTGTRLPIPDYPIVVEGREFEEAKRSEIPGLTMSVDADPARSVAVADAGAAAIPAIVAIRSLHTESRTILESDAITATSTTSVSGIDLAGLVRIGSLVSTASVRSDGTDATCSGSVRVSDASIMGTAITIDDDGIHLPGQSSPPLGIGGLVAQALKASGVQVRLLGGTDGCSGSLGNRTSAGLLVEIPTPAFGPVSAGGLQVVLASTSASAGGSTVPPLDDAAGTPIDVGGGAFDTGGTDGTFPSLSPTAPAPRSSTGAGEAIATQAARYEFDGVPGSLLVGLLLLALAGAGRIRRYLHHLIALVEP
jgi:hypothetical protein